MFWYPTDNGYVNLEKALTIEVKQSSKGFDLIAHFSFDAKGTIVLRNFPEQEEANQLLNWLINELNKKK
jgi:hypothetical protein